MKTTILYIVIAVLTVVRLVFFLSPGLWSTWTALGRARLKDFIDSLVSAGVVALLLVHFLVRPFYIPSGSMLQTLQLGDLLLVNKLIYNLTEPARRDIVVFHTDRSLSGVDPPLIKRVIGLEHDEVELKDGKLILNGQVVEEDFVNEGTSGDDFPPEKVEEGKIFVMGDNRGDSRDSRIIGQISKERLIGRAEVIIFPPSSWTSFNFPR